MVDRSHVREHDAKDDKESQTAPAAESELVDTMTRKAWIVFKGHDKEFIEEHLASTGVPFESQFEFLRKIVADLVGLAQSTINDRPICADIAGAVFRVAPDRDEQVR